jgi:heme a synthase
MPSAVTTPTDASRPSSRGGVAFQRFAIATLVATLGLIALGGAVRATDSGLACPDWPRCYGLWIPPADLNIWLEHSHRLVAGAVGIMIAILLVWALVAHRRREVLLPVVAAAVLVNVQAALGALVVMRLLQAELVTAHLGMAMVIVVCLAVLATRYRRAPGAGSRRPLDLAYARAALVIAALCFVQILVGGHVTGINAGLVFTDFPLYGGALFPEITSEREAFHVTHRLLAYVLAGGVVYLWWQAVRVRRVRVAEGAWGPTHRWLIRLPVIATLLVAAQIGLGVANLFNQASFITVIPHLAVASWIFTVLVLLSLHAYAAARAPGPETARAEAVA